MRGRTSPASALAFVAAGIGIAALVVADAGWASAVRVSNATLYYDAAPGETNAVQISQWTSGEFTVSDASIIEAGWGCRATDTDAAVCAGDGVTAVVVSLEDGNDRATLVDNGNGTTRTVYGGDGDDTVDGATTASGGGGDDTLLGTVLNGGDGNDTLSESLQAPRRDVRWSGGAGNDHFRPDFATGVFSGGAGIDDVDIRGEVSLDDEANDGQGSRATSSQTLRMSRRRGRSSVAMRTTSSSLPAATASRSSAKVGMMRSTAPMVRTRSSADQGTISSPSCPQDPATAHLARFTETTSGVAPARTP